MTTDGKMDVLTTAMAEAAKDAERILEEFREELEDLLREHRKRRPKEGDTFAADTLFLVTAESLGGRLGRRISGALKRARLRELTDDLKAD